MSRAMRFLIAVVLLTWALCVVAALARARASARPAPAGAIGCAAW